MYGIDILVEEHKNIVEFTDYLRRLCCDIINGAEVDIELFEKCIEFGRNYADKQHHGKEEKILFRIMLEKLGGATEKLIRNGMLVEHDLGRYHMTELENALENYKENPCTQGKLDIISNASGYAALLKRHIEKEDSVAYTFAMRMLSEDDKKKVDEETAAFEKESKENNIQDTYLNWLHSVL